MKLWESPTKSLRSAAVLAAAVGVVVFANSIANDFAYDDLLIIVDNPNIQSLETLPGTFFDPYWPNKFGRELGLWRPITSWVYGLQWIVWDGAPAGFHLTNVSLHSMNVLLLFAALRRMTGAMWKSAFVRSVS